MKRTPASITVYRTVGRIKLRINGQPFSISQTLKELGLQYDSSYFQWVWCCSFKANTQALAESRLGSLLEKLQPVIDRYNNETFGGQNPFRIRESVTLLVRNPQMDSEFEAATISITQVEDTVLFEEHSKDPNHQKVYTLEGAAACVRMCVLWANGYRKDS